MPLRLSFVQRLRDERAFPDVDALRAQIEADCRSRAAAVRPHFAVESFVMSQSPGTPGAPTMVAAPVGAGRRRVSRRSRATSRSRSPNIVGCAAGRRGQGDRRRHRVARRPRRAGGRHAPVTSPSSSTRSDDELRIEARCGGRSSEARSPPARDVASGRADAPAVDRLQPSLHHSALRFSISRCACSTR